MTVHDQPVAETPDPRELGLTVLSEHDMPSELTALVADVRALVDAVAHTEAAPEDLAKARESVAAATERISGTRRETGALMQQTRPDGTAEYGTLTNVVSGVTNPASPPLQLEHSEDGLRAEITLNGVYQGPPGLVHGGWIAAILDQALGGAASAAGMPGMTANLDVNYCSPTPLHTPLEITARVTGTERRKVFVSGEVRRNGTVTAEGTALMVRFAIPG